MAYIIEIPDENKQRIKEILSKDLTRSGMQYMVDTYYRYCRICRDWKKEARKAMACRTCRKQTFIYFTIQSENW